ncbi:MAG: aminodeoxychorismate synthase component I [Saprospiraceae bacterium]|nr:aminodeoxychorismate synthase component I [Saprospiraceae bacterium]
MPFFQTYQQTIQNISDFQNKDIPFLFILNFNKTEGFCSAISSLDPAQIQYSIHGQNLAPNRSDQKIHLKSNSISFGEYYSMFTKLQNEIENGNSYLTNLTCSSELETDLDLPELFQIAHAKYKLWVKDRFVVFSPECFIKIDGTDIFTFPMKGTINAAVPNAENILIQDSKEDAEHYTIIDLLRNDLHIVARDVSVSRFKYIDRIKTHDGELLQMSSQIQGTLRPEFENDFGALLDRMLPAGSVTGAPKKKTLEIIEQIENHQRGFYTGVFGVGSKNSLEVAVMIRFIEKIDNKLVFKSGGGITFDSEPQKEYQEMINKIYVPIF